MTNLHLEVKLTQKEQGSNFRKILKRIELDSYDFGDVEKVFGKLFELNGTMSLDMAELEQGEELVFEQDDKTLVITRWA